MREKLSENRIIIVIGFIASIITIYLFFIDKVLQKPYSDGDSVNKPQSVEIDSSRSKPFLEFGGGIINKRSIQLCNGNIKMRIFFGNIGEASLSPDFKKVVVVYYSEVYILNSDGEKQNVYYINNGDENMPGRQIRNLKFLDDRIFSIFIESDNNTEFNLGTFPISGFGEYRIQFDENNSILNVQRFK